MAVNIAQAIVEFETQFCVTYGFKGPSTATFTPSHECRPTDASSTVSTLC